MKSVSVSHSVVLTLCNPVDCSLPGSSVHGISQARILEWVAITFSRGSSHPGIESRSPTLQAGGCLGSQTSCHPVCSQGCLSQLEKGACARGHRGAFIPDRALVEQQQAHGGWGCHGLLGCGQVTEQNAVMPCARVRVRRTAQAIQK